MKEHFCPAEKTTITYQGKCNWCGESEGSMNEIIEMAQECNLIGMRPHLDGIYSESLVAFANLVAAKEREACGEAVMKAAEKAVDVAIKLEREACAKVCEGGNFLHDEAPDARLGKACAAAIRARGQA